MRYSANATELIIALVALKAGLIGIVKASITGAILANLVVMGLSRIGIWEGAVGRAAPFNRWVAPLKRVFHDLGVGHCCPHHGSITSLIETYCH